MEEKITAKVETITPDIAKTMLDENVNNRRISRDNRVRIAALTIKAWNKWRKGKPLRQLKFSAGESFPTPR